MQLTSELLQSKPTTIPSTWKQISRRRGRGGNVFMSYVCWKLLVLSFKCDPSLHLCMQINSYLSCVNAWGIFLSPTASAPTPDHCCHSSSVSLLPALIPVISRPSHSFLSPWTCSSSTLLLHPSWLPLLASTTLQNSAFSGCQSLRSLILQVSPGLGSDTRSDNKHPGGTRSHSIMMSLLDSLGEGGLLHVQQTRKGGANGCQKWLQQHLWVFAGCSSSWLSVCPHNLTAATVIMCAPVTWACAHSQRQLIHCSSCHHECACPAAASWFPDRPSHCCEHAHIATTFWMRALTLRNIPLWADTWGEPPPPLLPMPLRLFPFLLLLALVLPPFLSSFLFWSLAFQQPPLAILPHTHTPGSLLLSCLLLSPTSGCCCFWWIGILRGILIYLFL